MRVHHLRRGSGPPLLLLHGIGDSHRTWSLAMGTLAREHEVFAVDMPGFGRSAAIRGEPTTVGALARALVDFMAWQGLERFHVAGNSLGGGVALQLALGEHALSACALSPIGFVRGWERAFLRGSLRITHGLARVLVHDVLRDPVARRALFFQMMNRGDRMPYEVLSPAVDELVHAPAFDDCVRETSTWEFAGTPRCPVTVAWGEHDRLLLPRQAERARTALPLARHVTLTGCGHLPVWDDPDQVARVVLESCAAA